MFACTEVNRHLLVLQERPVVVSFLSALVLGTSFGRAGPSLTEAHEKFKQHFLLVDTFVVAHSTVEQEPSRTSSYECVLAQYLPRFLHCI